MQDHNQQDSSYETSKLTIDVLPPVVNAGQAEKTPSFINRFDCAIEDNPNLPAIRAAVLFTATLLCILGNIFLPAYFWRRNQEYLGLFASGFLIAQVGVLAVWTAIGTQAFKIRFAGTMFFTFLVVATYTLGLQVPDWLHNRLSKMPYMLALVLAAVGFGAVLLTSPIFALIFRFVGLRLVEKRELDRNDTASGPISLGYLIGITTVVGIVLAIFRAVMPEQDDQGMPYTALFFALFFGQSALYYCLCTTGTTILLLATSRNWHGAVVLAVAVSALPLNIFLLSFYGRFQISVEHAAMYLSTLIGYGIAISLFALLIRLTGYKLVPR